MTTKFYNQINILKSHRLIRTLKFCSLSLTVLDRPRFPKVVNFHIRKTRLIHNHGLNLQPFHHLNCRLSRRHLHLHLRYLPPMQTSCSRISKPLPRILRILPNHKCIIMSQGSIKSLISITSLLWLSCHTTALPLR